MELTFERIAMLMYLAESRVNLTLKLSTDPGPEVAVWRTELAQVTAQLSEVSA
jgi:hypothetical protein